MHSLFLCNGDGMVLFKRWVGLGVGACCLTCLCRYFVKVASESEWEQAVFSITNKKWTHARNEVHQCVTYQ